jgi:hypothetical protein
LTNNLFNNSDISEMHELEGTAPKPGIVPQHKVKLRRKASVMALIIAVIIIISLAAGGHYLLKNLVVRGLQNSINAEIKFEKFSIEHNTVTITDLKLEVPDSETPLSAEKVVISYDASRIFRSPIGIRAITAIDIYEPDIILVANKHGNWNLANILREQDSADKMPPIKAPLRIHNGRIFFHDPRFKGISQVADPVDATLVFDGEKGIRIESIKAEIRPFDAAKEHWLDIERRGQKSSDGRDISHPGNVSAALLFAATGRMKLADQMETPVVQPPVASTSGPEPSRIDVEASVDPATGRVTMNIVLENVDAAVWGNYILRQEAVTILGGTLNANVELVTEQFVIGRPVEELLQEFEYRAELMLADVRVNFDFLPGHVETLTGRIVLENQIAFFDNVRGTYQGSPVTISGSIINFENPALNLLVQAPSIELERIHDEPIFPAAPIVSRGSVNTTMFITGHADNPIIKADLLFRHIQLDGRNFRNGDIAVKYFANSVTIDINRFTWQNGVFEGNAFINFEGEIPRFAIHLRGENADVGEIAKELFPGAAIHARSDFDVKILGTTQDPLVFGETSFQEFFYDGLSVNRGDANFLFHDNLLLVLGLSLITPHGNFFSPRTLLDFEREYMNSTIVGRNFVVPAIWSPELAGARGNFTAFVAGRFADPVIAGCISEAAFNLNQALFQNAAGCFMYTANTIYLSDISAFLNGTGVNFTGWFRNGSRAEGEFAYRINNFTPARLTVLIPGAFNLPLTSTMDIRGSLAITNGLYNWSLSGAGPLGNMVSSGNYSTAANSVNGYLAGWDMALGEFIPPDTREIVNPRRGNIIATASGPIRNLGLSFVARTPEGEVLGLPMSLTRANLTIMDDSLILHDSFLMGIARERAREENLRFNTVENLNKISMYWGTGTMDERFDSSLLARMYYSPYTLERYAYNSDCWYTNAFGPVASGSWNPLQGSYQASLGLPAKVDVHSYNVPQDTGNEDLPPGLDSEDTRRNNMGRFPQFQNVLDFSASGTINTRTGAIDLNTETRADFGYAARNIRLEPLNFDAGPIRSFAEETGLSGRLFASGILGRTIQNPVFQGNVQVPAGTIRDETFSLDAGFRAASERVDIDRLFVRMNTSEYLASGSVLFEPRVFYDLSLQVRQARVEQILTFITREEIPAIGILNANVQFSGTPQRFLVDGNVFLEDALIYGQPVDNLTLVVSSDRELIRVEQLTAVTSGGVVTGSGFLRNNMINFRLNTENFPIRNIQALANRVPGIAGQLDLEAVIAGPFVSPDVDLVFTTRNLIVRGHEFDRFSGSIVMRDQVLTISNITIQDAMSYWDMVGTIDFREPNIPLDLRSTIRNWPISTILTIVESPLLNQVTGFLNGEISLSGNLVSPFLHVTLNATEGQIGDVVYNRIDLDANIINSRLEISRLALATTDALATLSGFYAPEDNLINFVINVTNLPARIFRPFVAILQDFDGRIFADGTITGALTNPDMRIGLSVRDGRIGFVTFDELGGFILATSGVVTLQDFALRKDTTVITIEGTIPLELRNGRVVNVAPMELVAFVQEQSLEILGLFVPSIERATGTISAVLRLTGLYPDLQMQGAVQVRNGTINLASMTNPITNFNADIDFNGKEILVQTFTGNLGEGVFNLMGSARLEPENIAIETMRFVLTGSNLLFIIPNLITGRIDTKITLTGSSRNPFVGVVLPDDGRDFLTINNATLTFPTGLFEDLTVTPNGENRQEARFSLPEIRNFVFTLGQDVWFDFQGLFAQTRGSLLIHREMNQSPRLFGELHIERGSLRVPFLLRPFIIVTGTAFFDGGQPVLDEQGQIVDYRINPYFELTARTRILGVEIFTIFEGRLDELQTAFAGGVNPTAARTNITFYSIPPMSRQEIMRMLVGETYVGALVGDTITIPGQRTVEGAAVNVLAGYLQELLLGGLTRTLERTFELTEIYFRYSPQGMFTIEIARAIDAQERLFITYTRTKGVYDLVREIWGLEYKYLPNLRFRLETTEGAIIPSIRGVIEFDTFGEFFQRFINLVTFRRPREEVDVSPRNGTSPIPTPAPVPQEMQQTQPPVIHCPVPQVEHSPPQPVMP